MNSQEVNWNNQYRNSENKSVYPTEWVIRTIAGGNYPALKLDISQYRGKRILDMSCGDGRNLQLLLNLGFKVYASEISEEIVLGLKDKFPQVEFSVGSNVNQSYKDSFFDYVLSSSACYYLDPNKRFEGNLLEISRILKPKGYFIANVPNHENSVVKDAEINTYGEALITKDPYNLRNGYRFQVFSTKEDVEKALNIFFTNISIGSFNDDFYGLIVSGYMFVAQKR